MNEEYFDITINPKTGIQSIRIDNGTWVKIAPNDRIVSIVQYNEFEYQEEAIQLNKQTIIDLADYIRGQEERKSW